MPRNFVILRPPAYSSLANKSDYYSTVTNSWVPHGKGTIFLDWRDAIAVAPRERGVNILDDSLGLVIVYWSQAGQSWMRGSCKVREVDLFQWKQDGSDDFRLEPVPGILISIRFEENHCEDHQPRETQKCYRWSLKIFDQQQNEVFGEFSGDWDLDRPSLMSLADCKADAIFYYQNKLESALKSDLARTREDEQKLLSALSVVLGTQSTSESPLDSAITKKQGFLSNDL